MISRLFHIISLIIDLYKDKNTVSQANVKIAILLLTTKGIGTIYRS